MSQVFGRVGNSMDDRGVSYGARARPSRFVDAWNSAGSRSGMGGGRACPSGGDAALAASVVGLYNVFRLQPRHRAEPCGGDVQSLKTGVCSRFGRKMNQILNVNELVMICKDNILSFGKFDVNYLI